MDADQFWGIIDLARRRAGTIKGIPDWLLSHLAGQSIDYIKSFSTHFHEMRGRAYDGRLWLAVALHKGGCSDDSFDYFCFWLIANGKETYERVVQNPDLLAEVDTTDGEHGGPRLEAMGCVPEEAYRQKVGDGYADLPSGSVPASLKNSDVLNVRDDDDARLRELFPKLFALREKGRRARNS